MSRSLENRIAPRSAVLATVLGAFLAVGAACGSDDSSGQNTLPGGDPAATSASTPADQQEKVEGSGRPPSGSGQHSGATSGTGNQAAYTAAFAKCMRAHGFPTFPDPGAQGGQFGPGSANDPMSDKFQQVVNGACKSSAPKAWTQEGPGTGS
jgi:hypothetical protein